MEIKTEKINEIISQIEAILEAIHKSEPNYKGFLERVNPVYVKSARNLVHYTTFRAFDLRTTQKRLKNIALTRLSKAGGHLKSSLLKTRYILYSLLGEPPTSNGKAGLSIKNGKRLLTRNTKELLGYRSKGRRVRIMVTQPTEAAYDYKMVSDMVSNGMNCARINCAHDDPEIWGKIIANIKKASKAYGKQIKIAMDLAGPKIRTGSITPGPKVRKFAPDRDDSGNIISPAELIFVPEITEDSEPNTVPVTLEWLKKLNLGDELRLTDTRNKLRRIKIVKTDGLQVHAHCYETSYIGTGTIIRSKNGALEDVEVGELPQIEQYIVLRTGDLLTITKADVEGNPAKFDEDGKLVESANISCQLPEVFDGIKKDEEVLFDDGKIEGRIENVFNDRFEVRITRAKEKGSKLKAEKGMNFPNTNLNISGLTAKDKVDLEFIAKHADIVNFSFVNSKKDVEELLTELEKLGVTNKLSIILKIETKAAFDNLTEILLTAMQVKYIGVMIARGDLAVETGWDSIGKVQEEILAICEAAHVPVVWATQVLENFAKKGLPSRAEITDATASLKAECVMLNKGAYINEVLQLLNNILSNMERFHNKNDAMLPKMEKA
ncbi:pyruvate kinase [Flagellimonas pacifica]|uniref:pyruvate kinase n=1 Tax=Flagellimonas pacifica TaxID=1247520 RepID=A0A285MS70_9FLAO|nr:pyruvate kinase [Allomuricauda parva]SNY99968.1 pyruvate kinase [Allomuricauda parva]